MKNVAILKRTNEIMKQITAFEDEKYNKDELLKELLKLQDELRNIVYNDEHAKNADLRIWNVAEQLEILNKQRGNIADKEVADIVGKCKCIGRQISSLISGIAGEKKAFCSLLNMNCKKAIVQNVELSYNGITTELDDVVVTKKGVFIVEVKNTGKDVFIDDNGNYYREGKCTSLDNNIGEKMNYKEQLLKDALSKLGKKIDVHSILVFTNSRVQVRNYYKYIRHCFLGQLPHIIEDYEGKDIFSDNDIEKIVKLLKLAGTHEKYSLEMDYNRFKREFAELLAILEVGEYYDTEKTNDSVPDSEDKGTAKSNWIKYISSAIGVTTVVVGGLLIKREIKH